MDFVKVSSTETMKSLLVDFDKEFTLGLMERINDIDQYVAKLITNSENYCVYENGEIFGFICFYANDKESECSYISQLCVRREIRNKGIGSFIINECKLISKECGMNKIQLEVKKTNENAINFYQKNDFTFSGERSEYDTYFMECKL